MGSKRTFAAPDTEVCSADKAELAVCVANDRFPNAAAAAKPTLGGNKTFVAGAIQYLSTVGTRRSLRRDIAVFDTLR
jgi:hypothetical protein